MEKLSVVILTLNVDHIIGRCLEALRGISDDIVILDGASTDKTVEICRKYTDKIITRYDPESKATGGIIKNQAIAQTKNDWILNVDADEIVSPQLKHEILRILKEGTPHAGFYIKRKDFFLDAHFATTKHLRLFRKSKGTFQHYIHETVDLKGQAGTLEGTMDHYSYKDVSDYLRRIDRYTMLEARRLYEKNPRLSNISIVMNTLLRAPLEFFLWYFGKGLWKCGLVGFFYSCCSSFYQIMKYLKYYELKHNKK